MRAFAQTLITAALLSTPGGESRAQTPADFFKGRAVDLYIGYSVGGGYDVYARMVARHMGRRIPGNTAHRSQEHGGSRQPPARELALQCRAPGRHAFGTVSRGAPFDPLLGAPAAQFDGGSSPGSAAPITRSASAWLGTRPASPGFEDLLSKELVVGGSSAASDTDQFAKLLNALFGTKLRLATGYPGGNEVNLAIERGEVGGRCGWSWSSVVATHKHWLEQNRVAVLIPDRFDQARRPARRPARRRSGEDRAAAPDRPADFRAASHGPSVHGAPGRSAGARRGAARSLQRTMKDPQFLADADKAKLEITPVSGADIEKLVKEVYGTSKETAAEAAAMIR